MKLKSYIIPLSIITILSLIAILISILQYNKKYFYYTDLITTDSSQPIKPIKDATIFIDEYTIHDIYTDTDITCVIYIYEGVFYAYYNIKLSEK